MFTYMNPFVGKALSVGIDLVFFSTGGVIASLSWNQDNFAMFLLVDKMIQVTILNYIQCKNILQLHLIFFSCRDFYFVDAIWFTLATTNTVSRVMVWPVFLLGLIQTGFETKASQFLNTLMPYLAGPPNSNFKGSLYLNFPFLTIAHIVINISKNKAKTCLLLALKLSIIF